MNQPPTSQQTVSSGSPVKPVAADFQRRHAFNTSIGVALVVTTMTIFGIVDAWTSLATLVQTRIAFAIFAVIDLLAVYSILANRKEHNVRAIFLMLLGVMAGGVATNLVLAGLGLVLGITIFALTVTVAARSLPTRFTNRIILLGTASAGAAYVIDEAATWTRDLASPEIIPILFGILSIAIFFFAIFLIRVYGQFPMLTKVILPFMALSIASVAALSTFNSLTTRYALTESANQKLRAAALQTAAQVDAFYASIANSMQVERSLSGFVRYLQLPADARLGSDEEREANTLLRSLQARGFIRSYSLLDAQGNVLLNTQFFSAERARELPRLLEIDLAQPDFLSLIQLQDIVVVSPVQYDTTNQPVIYFAIQVTGSTGLPVGVLVAEYSLARIQTEIAVQNNGLAGPGSFASIITNDGIRIANGIAPSELNRLISTATSIENIQALIASHRLPALPVEQLVGDYPDYSDALLQAIEIRLSAGTALEAISGEETGAYFYTASEAGSVEVNDAAMVRAANFPWYISYMQPQRILLAPVEEQNRQTTLLGIAVAAIVVVASTLIAQTLTRPIQRLTDTAEQVAEGNLSARADVRSQDELGVLAGVFNEMTEELGQTLQGLEQRVEERTRELEVKSTEAEQRASQLEAIADVSRAIASERELDNLLPLITNTISSRFGFYHVGIFLIDERGEFAVLRAANSEGGQRMLARSHRLRVGQEGIIGYVTSRGEARIALDVGRDAVFFNNPDLPTTRSEMGLPLHSSGKVIGALDVQSTQSAAFSEADVSLLSIMSDQVSIAIENARLFSDTRRALDELEAIQRQYVRQQWQRQATEANRSGYVYDSGQLRPHASAHLAARGAVDEKTTLSAPISLRGQEIGEIELFDPVTQRSWSDEERSLAEAVAQQVGLALENARLLEETQRRAERESLVAQITSRLRASNDPQMILQTAVKELREALQASKAQILVPDQSGKPESAKEE